MVQMGRVAGSYGLHGWVRVTAFDEPESLAAQARWNIAGIEVAVEQTKLHSGALLAKLAGIESREAALKLKGAEISVPREAFPDPGPGRYYWVDLVGLEVVNLRGAVLGTIEQVSWYGAQDVIEVAGERKRLLPWVDAVVKRVDLAARRVEVDWEADW